MQEGAGVNRATCLVDIICGLKVSDGNLDDNGNVRSNNELEDTARYAGLLLAPAEGFGRGFFCPVGKKRAYYAVLAHFWHFLVSSSNLGNF